MQQSTCHYIRLFTLYGKMSESSASRKHWHNNYACQNQNMAALGPSTPTEKNVRNPYAQEHDIAVTRFKIKGGCSMLPPPRSPRFNVVFLFPPFRSSQRLHAQGSNIELGAKGVWHKAQLTQAVLRTFVSVGSVGVVATRS